MSAIEISLTAIVPLIAAVALGFGVYKWLTANRNQRETAWADVVAELSKLHISFRRLAKAIEETRVWLFSTYRLLSNDPKWAESLKSLENSIEMMLRGKRSTQRSLDRLDELIAISPDDTPSFKAIARARRYARRLAHLVQQIDESVEEVIQTRQEIDKLLGH